MSEVFKNQELEDCQAVETELDINRKTLMQQLGIKSVNTLKSWCGLWGIEYKAEFTPDEVAKLRHSQHWIQVKKLSIAQYKNLINDRQADPQAQEQDGCYTAKEEVTNQSTQVKQAIQERYGKTIKSLSKPIADAFWRELDTQVMRELVTTAKRQDVPLIESSLLACLSSEEEETLFFLTPQNSEIPLLAGSPD